ncbi:hypothetical protein ACQPZX_31660 [Actinoplanes sp. CA-142083]|uniref:hypothetical protein n=1 Tax=Actinoplanes sp. CA-142083 TaxID=3239903 RepID=UPI003D8A87F6
MSISPLTLRSSPGTMISAWRRSKRPPPTRTVPPFSERNAALPVPGEGDEQEWFEYRDEVTRLARRLDPLRRDMFCLVSPLDMLDGEPLIVVDRTKQRAFRLRISGWGDPQCRRADQPDRRAVASPAITRSAPATVSHTGSCGGMPR